MNITKERGTIWLCITAMFMAFNIVLSSFGGACSRWQTLLK